MLKNSVKRYMFIIIAALCCTVANAQDGNITISEEERALALSIYTNGECFVTPEQADGILTWEGHGGWYFGIDGNATAHHLSNNDGVGGTGTKITFGGDGIIGYTFVKKGWLLAVNVEAHAGANNSYSCEGRSVGVNFHAGARAKITNSHGWIQAGPILGYEYENMVSENVNGTPWRGHVHKLELGFGLEKEIFTISRVKNSRVGNKIIPVRGKYQVKAFANVIYSPADIGKYWDDTDALKKGFEPELKDKQLKFELGLKFYFR